MGCPLQQHCESFSRKGEIKVHVTFIPHSPGSFCSPVPVQELSARLHLRPKHRDKFLEAEKSGEG